MCVCVVYVRCVSAMCKSCLLLYTHFVCVCVCVCLRERESKRDRECVCVRVCVCLVCVKCVYVCMPSPFRLVRRGVCLEYSGGGDTEG